MATFGIRAVVAPLLEGVAPDAQLTLAGGLLSAPKLRAEGKRRAIERKLDAEAVADAVVVTDSEDDENLLSCCGHPILVRWQFENSGGSVPCRWCSGRLGSSDSGNRHGR